MVGPTLVDIREHAETLASDDGEYYIVCGRTGDRPVPVDGLRFDGRGVARNAARATEQYRSTLRRYDPQVPYCDLIVCQRASRHTAPTRSGDRTTAALRDVLFRSTPDCGGPERRILVEFCHRIAGAVFETLSEVLVAAATRLQPVDETRDAITGSLSTLDVHGLIESYTHSPWSVALDGDTRSAVVRVDGYALSSYDGRLPVLPLTVELARHRPARLPRSVAVTTVDGGLQFTFSMADTTDRGGLVSAPIDGGL